MRFKDRHEAGIKLAEKLKEYKGSNDLIVLAIPRGGVEIGYEAAKFLGAKLDIIVTKKIGLPNDEEFAIGSVAPDKKIMLNEQAIKIYNVPRDYIKKSAKEIGKEIERRYREYKGKYELPVLKGKTAILTDDGIATGFTTRAAIEYVQSQNPKKVILAVPVAPANFAEKIKGAEIVCLHSSDKFYSISQFYENFPQLEDDEVKRYLSEFQ